jgi:hypothetical protein
MRRKAMSEHDVDLSLVPPDRREEIARRINAVRRYLQSPSRQAAIDGADELGLALVTFYNLAKAWRDAPRPENLAGAGRPRQRRSSMTPEQIAIVDKAIATSAVFNRAGIVDHALALAEAAGVDVPSRYVVRNHIDRSKPASIPHGAMASEADLVLDECVIDIPVAFGGQVIRPLCSVLFEARTFAPVGLHLSARLPTPAVAAATILDALDREPSEDGDSHGRVPLLDLHVGDGPDWITLQRALTKGGVAAAARPLRARGSGKVMTSALGGIRGLRFRPRMLLTRDRSFEYRLKAQPMDLADASDNLRARLGLHRTRETASLCTRGQREALAEALRAIVGSAAC